ncbi:MAG: ABC transporter ATP-binding protein [Bdellovibrionaceae bacterium]|nr:ABC transporter ATP-binding protein [Pseudobdellovibrionaceae bacterium]
MTHKSELAALEIENLTKCYGTFEAVKKVSFNIFPGEVFALLGPNGAGKTSIISIISTLEKLTSGSVKIFGVDIEKETMQSKRLIGVVHQEIVNSGFFDVTEILDFMSGYYGIYKNSERINYILHKLGLYEHRQKKVKQLSGGMKRRLMVAKALVHSPKLLLLDEPTAGVDIQLREDLWNFVRELQSEGMSVLLTTHYLQEAQELCQRIGILDKGQLKLVGQTKEIIKQFSLRKILIKTKTEESHYEANAFFEKKDQGYYSYFLPDNNYLGKLLQELSLKAEDILDIQTQEGSLEMAFKKAIEMKS